MKIDRKVGTIIAISIFVSLLAIGLTMNYQAARKKGKDTWFDFSAPQSVEKK